MANQTGRHFLQIPGPTPVPERILNAMSRQMLDHRGPTFGEFGLKLLADVKTIFKTVNPVIIYPASGTGAWEAGLVNTLSPGDKVLIVETGQFAVLWRNMAGRLGLNPEVIPTDWHGGADANAVGLATTSDNPGSADAFERGSLQSSDPCSAPPVVWSAQDLSAARAVVALPATQVAGVVADGWARWSDPRTGTDELLTALGLPAVGPFDDVVARPGESC